MNIDLREERPDGGDARAAKRVLVLGGRGFIGRHAVTALQRAGATVVVGTRTPRHDPDGPAEEAFVLHQMLDSHQWDDAVSRFDVILNCVGILRQRYGETYDAVHHRAPVALAAACRRHGKRLVHVSALALSLDAKSRFISSKRRGELGMEEAGGNIAIARLSLLDGEGGYGAAWLRGVARLPVFVVPASARGGIAALTADDAGEALANLCLKDEFQRDVARDGLDEFELGGEQTFTFEGYIRGLRQREKPDSSRAVRVRVPGWLARLGSHVCDLFHFTPFSFGHWELLCTDNVPRPNRLREVLGRAPQAVLPER